MSRIVVAEKIAESGLTLLRERGHDVQDLSSASRVELLGALAEADALLVRSVTAVDAELLAAAPRLQVVARAGVGVDNVDVPAATARGVLVLSVLGLHTQDSTRGDFSISAPPRRSPSRAARSAGP